jgi:hypothetical protein
MRPSEVVQTATSVPPPPPGSPLRAAASMTLASMRLTAPVTPLFVSETVAEVEDLTGSDKGGAKDTEISSGGQTTDQARKLEDSERKKKEWSEAEAAKDMQVEFSSSASTLMPNWVSPRKLSPQKAIRVGVVTVPVNWSSSDDVRMVLVACCPEMQKLFELLGHPSNRFELQGSNSATDARPSTAFYEKLAEIFSDSVFKGHVPDDWARDEHLPPTKLYALRQGRDGAWMKDKWRSLGARHEVAWHRYSGVSGADGYSSFCGWLRRRDKSATDCCSDSSLLRLHTTLRDTFHFEKKVGLDRRPIFPNLNTELFQVPGSVQFSKKRLGKTHQELCLSISVDKPSETPLSTWKAELF